MDTLRISCSLDGTWNFVPDPNDVGCQEKWFSPGDHVPSGQPLQVPGVWDRIYPDLDGAAWYFRDVVLGDQWTQRTVALHFEAANYYTQCWVNGIPVGDHEGGFTPFAFDITGQVVEGTNRIAVRVVCPRGPQGTHPFKPEEFTAPTHKRELTFAGIWGSVAIEGKAAAHFTDVFVIPDIRRKVLQVKTATSQPGLVRLRIEGTTAQAEGESGDLVVPFPQHETWSPLNPTLYTLHCELLHDGQVVDTTAVRFGMREFTVRDGSFYLNNRPFFVKAVTLTPDYPNTVALPESSNMVHTELALAKEAGFNMVVLRERCAPRETVQKADELGLLICEGPVIGPIKKSPLMQERCEREVRELVMRDRNNPSVVIWRMVNDTGNAAYVTKAGAQTLKNDLCAKARTLDPSRLIIDDLGGVNRTREAARYMRPFHNDLEAFDDIVIHQRAPVDKEMELYYTHCGAPGRLAFLSGAGFGGLMELRGVIGQFDQNAASHELEPWHRILEAVEQGFEERNLDRVFGNLKGFAVAMGKVQAYAAKYQLDALRANQKLAGYCYGQLADSRGHMTAGLLDIWRRKKTAFGVVKQAQRPLRPIIQAAKTNLVPREEVQVNVLLANDARVEGQAEVSLQVVGPTNQVLWKKKRALKIPRSGRQIWFGKIAASGSTGTHKFVVRLIQHGKIIAQNTIEFHVIKGASKCDDEIHVLDPDHEWQGRCISLAKQGTILSPLHIIPPLANTIRAYPDNDLAQILAQVRGGAVAICFEPPKDWNDLASRIDPAIAVTQRGAVGTPHGAYHYAKLHPVFDGLPARRVMRQQYRDTVAANTFAGLGDEDICGVFDTSELAAGNTPGDTSLCWGSDILVRRYGSGRIVFTHLRVLENIGRDPVAEHLFVNMLRHFGRRSVPSSQVEPIHQPAVEWLRTQRAQHVRRWMVLGMFPNWNSEGHDKAFPPEEAIDFNATYPGWYKAITWHKWFSKAQDDHWLDLQEALSPVYQDYPRYDHGTAYAYAEFTVEKRQAASMRIGLQNATKIWLNGSLVHESNSQMPHDQQTRESAQVSVKQGRNTILVKVSKTPGPCGFDIQFEATSKEHLPVKWWK